MATQQETVNKQTFYITVFIVFIVGFISGVGFSIYKLDSNPGTTQGNVTQQQGLSEQESQAILNLEAEVTANPGNYNAWTQLGHLYFDSDQHQKAIGAYTKSLELHSGDANLLTDLGIMYRRAGNSPKAIESFDKAMSMNATHQPSRLNKGIVLYYDFGKADEAITAWDSVLKINPQAVMANGTPLKDFIDQVRNEQKETGSVPAATQGNVAQQEGFPGQEDPKILSLEAEVTANPGNYNSWTQLGHLYFDSDQFQKAIGAYTKSLELHAGDANLWTDLGVMYRRSGDSAKAIESFDKAISMDANHEQSRLNKGIVLYYDSGKVDEAIVAWESVLKINPAAVMSNGTPLKDFVEKIRK